MTAYSVKGDPYWIDVKYPTRCSGGKGHQAYIGVGSRAFYYPRGKFLLCRACGEIAERQFFAEVDDEVSSGGWS